MSRVVVWGFPCGRSLDSEWLRRMFAWAANARDNWEFPWPIIAAHSARVDLARSFIIEVAQKNECSWMLQLDTDVSPLPNMPVKKFMAILEEDRRLGFDVVIAPTLSQNGIVMGWGAKPGSVVDDAPFEVDGGAGGCFAMTKKAVDGLRLISTIDGPDGNFKVFCRQSEHGTEDSSLFFNARKSGFKVGMDRRLRVCHRKSVDYYIDDAAWKRAHEYLVLAPPSHLGDEV